MADHPVADLAAEGGAVLAAATPGPWEVHQVRPTRRDWQARDAIVSVDETVARTFPSPDYPADADAIVWLRNHAAELLAAYRDREHLIGAVAHLTRRAETAENRLADALARAEAAEWDMESWKTAAAAEAVVGRRMTEAAERETERLRATLNRLVVVIDGYTGDGDDYVDGYTEALRWALDPQHGATGG